MSLFDQTMPQLSAVAEEITMDFSAFDSHPPAPVQETQQQLGTPAQTPELEQAPPALVSEEHAKLGQSFPPPASSTSTSTALKRLSLPTSILPPSTSSSFNRSHNRQASLNAISSLPEPASDGSEGSRRRSHSPTRLTLRASHSSAPVPLAHRQHVRSASLSQSGSAGSLLSDPASAQLHALKARHAALEKSYSSLKADQSSSLFKATARITALETALEAAESIRLEADSWEAEAKSLANELTKADRKAKDAVVVVVAKSEVNLEAERDKKKRYKGLNEKLRLELVGRRLANRWDIGVIDAEDRKRDADAVKTEVDLVRAEMERQLALLEVDDVREQSQRRVSKLTRERAEALAAQVAATASTKEAKRELASAEKRASALEKDLARLEKQIESAAQGEQKADAKAAADARKALEKERAKREKAESDAIELKAALKAAQDQLKTVKSSVAPPVKIKKVPTPAPVESEPEESHAQSEVEEEPVPTRKPKKAAPAPAPTKVVSDAEDMSEDEGETDPAASYQPQKSRSRAVPLPKKRSKPVEQDYEEPRAKAVLGEKTTNVKAKPVAVVAEKKKEKKVVKEVQEKEEEPAKKKMRKLFGGPKKFDWGSIENADVNALGLPASLSPVKGLGAAHKLGGGALSSFGLQRKNIFGGAA